VTRPGGRGRVPDVHGGTGRGGTVVNRGRRPPSAWVDRAGAGATAAVLVRLGGSPAVRVGCSPSWRPAKAPPARKRDRQRGEHGGQSAGGAHLGLQVVRGVGRSWGWSFVGLVVREVVRVIVDPTRSGEVVVDVLRPAQPRRNPHYWCIRGDRRGYCGWHQRAKGSIMNRVSTGTSGSFGALRRRSGAVALGWSWG